jgi:hypothetical protein
MWQRQMATWCHPWQPLATRGKLLRSLYHVRPRAIQMRSMLVQTIEVHRNAVAEGSCSGRFVKQQLRCIGAGRPSVGGRRTGSLCHGFLQHRLGLSVLWRPAHQRFSSDARTGQTRVCVQQPLSLSGRSMKRSLRFNSMRRVATREAGTVTNTSMGSPSAAGGALIAQAAERIKISARSVLSLARPNPSVEGTSNIKLRLLSASPHVKR